MKIKTLEKSKENQRKIKGKSKENQRNCLCFFVKL
jgi:hypothetical protein